MTLASHYEEHDTIANGIRLHYLEWPTPVADGVVWLHGGGLHAHTWEAVATELSASYHSYALDSRGHGDSEWSPNLDYRLETLAADVAAFCEQLTCPRLFIVGHSLGAYTAMYYAARHSSRLAGLVLVDSTPYLKRSPRMDRLSRFMRGRDDFASVDEAVDYARTYDSRRNNNAHASMRQALRQLPNGRLAWKYDRRYLTPEYFQERTAEFQTLADDVGEICCPTRIVRGADGCPAADAQRFAEALPDAALVTIEDAGHNVHRDNPDAFAVVVRKFLDSRSDSPATAFELTSRDELRLLYKPPAQRSLDKEIDHLDQHCRDFIAHSPFAVLATAADASRVDASPRGGPPGFVTVLDDHRLAVPDMSGNNRLDSLNKIVADGRVGLLFLIPGIEETLRVNGQATVTTDPAVLDRCEIRGLRPNVAVIVHVEAAFIHCAKALRRADLWHPAAWPDTTDMPTPACILRDHIGLEASVADSQRFLDESYAATTWQVGGQR